MCGIAGIVSLSGAPIPRLASGLALLDRLIAHRGPDSHDIWVDAEAGIAVSHRRLAIVDLTPAGAQPMFSHCGRYVMVYNGEVYNAQELRQELSSRGINWRGHSDTEVMVEACEAWGVDTAVKRFIGMFAFALWDLPGRRLTLVRDRLGIKPLYWGETGGTVVFGSQPKAILAHPDWRPASG